jgi:hypothetical protein
MERSSEIETKIDRKKRGIGKRNRETKKGQMQRKKRRESV